MTLAPDGPSIEGYLASLGEKLANLERLVLPSASVLPEAISAKVENGVSLRLENGTIRFLGAIKSLAEIPASTMIFRLPKGYRPSAASFPRIHTPNVSSLTYNLCNVDPSTGNVVVANAVPINNYLTFDSNTLAL